LERAARLAPPAHVLRSVICKIARRIREPHICEAPGIGRIGYGRGAAFEAEDPAMRSRRVFAYLGVAIVASVALTTFDIALTENSFYSTEAALDLVDTALRLLVMALIAEMAVSLRGVEAAHDSLSADVRRAVALGEAWRDAHRARIEDFSRAVAEQFDAWGLTAAEADIATLMLKGMSMKDIAAARGATEGTTRQQARGVYRKSGLSGRSELAAYFLDALSPGDTRAETLTAAE
jgi:DNA-binding CsgD family transcriptional regulator